jgi:ubiquilin
MGAPPDPEQMIQMLQNPEFAQTMNAALSNPQFLDMMIRSNPMLQNMGPGVRQMMQSEEFRRMLTDPETIRRMTQVGRQLGVGPWAGGGGAEAFPAPGVTAQTPTTNTPSNESREASAQEQQQPNPFASLFGIPPPGGTGAQAATTANPFASLFPPATTTTPPTNAAGTPPNQPLNPLASLFAPHNPQDPQALQQLLAAMGGNGPPPPGAGFNPFAGFGGIPPPPADTRPPEDRYAEQLRQLNDMGFYDFDRNVEALRRTGGSVQGAVEYLLSH